MYSVPKDENRYKFCGAVKILRRSQGFDKDFTGTAVVQTIGLSKWNRPIVHTADATALAV